MADEHGEWVRPLGVPGRPNGADMMRAALTTFEERNAVYKDTHTMHGNVLAVMFPFGITLNTSLEHSRYVTLNQIIGKLCRYATNFTNGGHGDSIHDVGVYAFILEAIDRHAQTPQP